MACRGPGGDPVCEQAPEDPGIKICADDAPPEGTADDADIKPPDREVSARQTHLWDWPPC